MADEPRRSGRATKGQHTKNAEDDLPAASTPTAGTPAAQKPASTKAPAKGGSKKTTKKDEAASSAGDDDDDSIIRCVCGATADEEGWPMICCDKCEAWQHNLCMGISEDDAELPEKYFCELCKPKDHASLLAAMKRGEKPWEIRIKERKREEAEEAKRKKKGKGRKSAGGGGTATPKEARVGTPVEAGNKRKFEETPVESAIKKSASPAVSATPSLARRKSSAQVIVPDAKRRKSTIDVASHSRKSSIVLPTPASSIESLPANRQNAAKAINSKSKSVIESLSKNGSYRIPDGETASSLASTLALQIENALLAVYGEVGAYRTQFLAIHSNIPKNPVLVLQLLMGELEPVELAEMSSDDMASEDVQRERAKAKEEADKQSILITEQGPRVRKTHKGEEIMGEDIGRTSGAVDDASWATRPVRRDTQDESMLDANDDEQGGESPTRVELPDDSDARGNPPPPSVDTKRKSSSYNLDRAWGAAHSPDQPSYSARSAVQPPQQHRGDTQMHDADIDRLLKDEEDEDMVSPALEGPTVWKGRVDMAGVASFSATARWVAGADVASRTPYTSLLPSTLAITGRIAVARADEYVAGMRYSQSNDVVCLAIESYPRDRASFDKIWRYFSEKERWGVVAPAGLGSEIRDAYLVTLNKGEGAWPGFMDILEHREIPEPRESEALILTLVVKTRSPNSTPSHNPGATPSLNPAPSPVIPQNGTMFTPTPAPAVNYPWATPMVREILGAFVEAPAVVQLFSAVPEMSEQQIRNLKIALDSEPGAREDLVRLGDVLRAGVGQ